MALDLMARMQGERNLKLFRPLTPPPGWKCPKRFRLGVGRGWEGSSDSDDEETDELLLMASQQYEEQAQTQDSASFDAVAQRNGQFLKKTVHFVVHFVLLSSFPLKTQEQNSWIHTW